MKRTDITALLPDIDKDVLDKIMDLNGADVSRTRGELDDLRSQLSSAQSRIQQLETSGAAADKDAKIQALTDELAGLRAANAVRDIRESVAKELGIPASLLTESTEEACKAQAEAIKSYAEQNKAPSYPGLPDRGEVHTPSSSSARDKFAEWAKDAL